MATITNRETGKSVIVNRKPKIRVKLRRPGIPIKNYRNIG